VRDVVYEKSVPEYIASLEFGNIFKSGDELLIDTTTGMLVGMNGNLFENLSAIQNLRGTASVSLGAFQDYTGSNEGLFFIPVSIDALDSAMPSDFWDNRSLEQIAAAYGAAWDRQHVQRPDDWGAIVNAGRETFGNAVFQQPLTTLVTAGAQATVLAGTTYAGMAVAPSVAAGAIAGARPVWVAAQVAVVAHGPGVGNTATSALRFIQYSWYRAQAAITQAITSPRPPPPASGPPIP